MWEFWKKKLIEFDNHTTIYRVHIQEQNKMIKVKNLQIFENTITKTHSSLLNFDKKLTFNKVHLLDSKEDLPISESITSEDKIKIKKYTYKAIPLAKHQKLTPTTISPNQILAGQIVKPTPKAGDKIILLL